MRRLGLTEDFVADVVLPDEIPEKLLVHAGGVDNLMYASVNYGLGVSL